jgi:hypothetical protein
MGAIKELFIDMQDEMDAVARQLTAATEDGDPDFLYDTLVECTAKLAVVTRRYHGLYHK